MNSKPKSEQRFFEIRIAETEEDLRAAQRLRYKVFVEELGALGPTVDHKSRLETDDFDQYYDHLLLIDNRRDAGKLEHVVGVYRLLRGDVALAGPGFYSADEYDLDLLIRSGRKLLELGRSCVDTELRGGISMYLLWNALADYVLSHDIEVMFGVASYHGTDLEPIAQSLTYLMHNHTAPADMLVRVRNDDFQDLDLVDKNKLDKVKAMAQTPALIKAYLKLGGFIGEGAFIDCNFNTVDVCVMMDTERMSQRHRRAYTRKVEARAW